MADIAESCFITPSTFYFNRHAIMYYSLIKSMFVAFGTVQIVTNPIANPMQILQKGRIFMHVSVVQYQC